MKRWLFFGVLGILLAMGFAVAEALEPKALTVMVYMCGSNLETLSGSATADIGEMLQSDFDADRVNLVVMAGGSRRWDRDLRPGEAGVIEFFRKRGALKKKLVRPESNVNMGDPQTLTGFIRDSLLRYPAEEYALILWDHGAGPLEGVCLDELNEPDRISLDGLAQALKDARLPQKLSWIGFDACLMSTLEVANAVAPYAEYMIASEETEPATGWNYAFLKGVDTDGGSVDTARRIIDLYMETPREAGEALTLACTDLSRIGAVVLEMDAFFDPISRHIDRENFAALSSVRVSSLSFGHTVRGVGVDGYDLVDLKDLTLRYAEENDAQALLGAVAQAVVYQRATEGGVGGLSVYHPYYNKTMYRENWGARYGRLGFCESYAEYVKNFGALLAGETLADWRGLSTRDEGFDAEGANRFSVRLTPEQQANLSSAQLIALYPRYGVYDEYDQASDRFADAGDDALLTRYYSPVYIDNASVNDAGVLSAHYAGRALYVTDDGGNAIFGPIAYRLSADGSYCYISAEYSDASGREDLAVSAKVLLTCRTDDDGALSVVRTEVYDPMTDTYSNRLPLSLDKYTLLTFDNMAAEMPDDLSPCPGFDEWKKTGVVSADALPLHQSWGLRFFDSQQSGIRMLVAFQITDLQQNTYMSDLLPVTNPNLEMISVLPRAIDRDGMDISCYVLRDTSPLEASISLCVRVTNRERQNQLRLDNIQFNDCRTLTYTGSNTRVSLSDAGETQDFYIQVSSESLTGLAEIRSIGLLFDGDEAPTVFYPEHCDIADLAPQSRASLAEASEDGVTLELTRLETDYNGDLKGLIHIVNDGPDDFRFGPSMDTIVDGVCMESDMDAVSVRGGTDGYSAFTLHNSTYAATNMWVADARYPRLLTMDHLHERCAGAAIRQICLFEQFAAAGERRWAFELSEPFPLEGGDSIAPDDFKTLPLMEGAISMEVERVLVGDDGVCARVIMRNHTDKNVRLQVANKYLIHDDGYHTEVKTPQWFRIGARGMTVGYVEMLGQLYEVTGVGFTLQCDDSITSLAMIHFRDMLTWDEPGGRYLSPDDLKTSPVQMEEALGSVYRPEYSSLAIRILVKRADGTGSPEGGASDDMGKTAAVDVIMEVDNWSDRLVLDAVCADFEVDGVGLPQIRWAEDGIQPRSKARGTVSIDVPALRLSAPAKVIKCTMYLSHDEVNYAGEHYTATNRYDYAIQIARNDDAGATESLPAEGEALCEAELDDVTWQLLAVSADEDGRITGSLRAVNHSDAVKEYGAASTRNAILVQGLSQDIEIGTLQPHSEATIPFAFENTAVMEQTFSYIYNEDGLALSRVDHLLQRQGIRRVTRLSVALDYTAAALDFQEDATATRQLNFVLPEPLILPDVPLEKMVPELLMRNGALSVSLLSACVGNGGITLALELRNDSDEDINLHTYDCFMDDERCGGIAENALAHSVRVLIVDCLPVDEEKDAFQNVHIGFEYGSGSHYRRSGFAQIHLREPVKMDRAEGFRLTSEAYEVTPAEYVIDAYPGVFDTLMLPLAQTVRPRTLTPPLNEDQIRRFESGQASVCVVARSDEDVYATIQSTYGLAEADAVGESERVAYEVATMDLARDGDGLVSARYSGLVLRTNDDLSPFHDRTVGEETTVEASIYHHSEAGEYYGFRIFRPEDPDRPPCVIPAFIPDDDPARIDQGRRRDMRFVLNRDANGLAVKKQSMEDYAQYTGERLEYTRELLFDWFMLMNRYNDGNYDDPTLFYRYCDYDGIVELTMSPIEAIPYPFVVRYHIRYTDGTEQTIVEDLKPGA